MYPDPGAVASLDGARFLGHEGPVMPENNESSFAHVADVSCSGPCARCGVEHTLPGRPAIRAAQQLMRDLEAHGRIDFCRPAHEADPAYSTAPLFGEARGHMFGVMAFRNADGSTGLVKAFSGQFNGQWLAPGWVGPLVDVDEFERVNTPGERRVKELGRMMREHEPGSETYARLRRERRELSRSLMAELHGLYRLRDFRGNERCLAQVFGPDRGIPTGTGDCCAPKLLHHAARNGLVPLGIAEFYWGRSNRSGTREHGRLYPSCREKCRPILGFMLCGLEELHV